MGNTRKHFRGCQINAVDSFKRITTSYVTTQPTDITIRETQGTEIVLGMTANTLLKSKWHQFVIVNKINGVIQSEIQQIGNSRYALLDDSDYNHNTQSTYSFFFSYPFLPLCSLSPHSIISNLHNLLSLSYSSHLVAG